jgi:hypothetical protein
MIMVELKLKYIQFGMQLDWLRLELSKKLSFGLKLLE